MRKFVRGVGIVYLIISGVMLAVYAINVIQPALVSSIGILMSVVTLFNIVINVGTINLPIVLVSVLLVFLIVLIAIIFTRTGKRLPIPNTNLGEEDFTPVIKPRYKRGNISSSSINKRKHNKQKGIQIVGNKDMNGVYRLDHEENGIAYVVSSSPEESENIGIIPAEPTTVAPIISTPMLLPVPKLSEPTAITNSPVSVIAPPPIINLPLFIDSKNT